MVCCALESRAPLEESATGHHLDPNFNCFDQHHLSHRLTVAQDLSRDVRVRSVGSANRFEKLALGFECSPKCAVVGNVASVEGVADGEFHIFDSVRSSSARCLR